MKNMAPNRARTNARLSSAMQIPLFRRPNMETPILNVQNVTVSFDGFKVLDNLNFAMDTGELRFLIGPNGAGKTTLLDIVTGKTRASSGRVVYDGNQDITRRQEHHRVRLGISRKFQ